MKVFEKILLYLNPEGVPEPALELAVRFARMGSRLTLIDVVDDFGWELAHALRPGWRFRESMIESRRDQLDRLRKKLVSQGVESTGVLRVGRPSFEIIREVLREGHDLVLTTGQPENRERGQAFGPVALRLLRMCPSAVWILQPSGLKINRILAAVDTGVQSDGLASRILDLAVELSDFHQAELHVLHAWNTNPSVPPREPAPDDLAEFERTLRSHAEKQLGELVANRITKIPPCNLHLVQGEAHRVINSFIRESEIDLIVMGTVARRGLAGLILGNTADRLMRQLRCSLLAIKPAGFVSPVTLDD